MSRVTREVKHSFRTDGRVIARRSHSFQGLLRVVRARSHRFRTSSLVTKAQKHSLKTLVPLVVAWPHSFQALQSGKPVIPHPGAGGGNDLSGFIVIGTNSAGPAGGNSEIVVVGPWGAVQPTAVSITQNINDGWTAAITLPLEVAVDFSEDEEVCIRICLDGGELTPPPFFANGPRERSKGLNQGEQTNLQCVDKWSSLLGKDGQNFPTFQDVTAQQIINTLAGSVGVPVQGSPPHNLLPIEDVKFQKPMDAILRLCKFFGYNFRITSTGILFFPVLQFSGSGVQFPGATTRQVVDPGRRVSGIWLQKTSRIVDSQCFALTQPGVSNLNLANPINISTVRDESANARVLAVSEFEGDLFIRTRFLQPGVTGIIRVPVESTGPATRLVVTAEPVPASAAPFSGRICVSGSAPGAAGFDREFRFFWGDQTRPARQPLTSELWGKQSDALGAAPGILFEQSKGYNRVLADGPISGESLSLRCGQVLTADGRPDSRIETITWDISPGDVGCSVAGVVI